MKIEANESTGTSGVDAASDDELRGSTDGSFSDNSSSSYVVLS